MFKLFDPVWKCVFDLVFSCKLSKLQYNSLAFDAGFNRATDEGSLPEIAQYSPYYLPLNVLLLPKDQTFIFYLTSTHNLCFGAKIRKNRYTPEYPTFTI